MKKKILWGLLAIVVVIQFIRPEQTNPETTAGADFLEVTQADPATAQIIRQACYDCHSHETVWPWYSRINPVGWVVSDHVVEGRNELNFSDWTSYSAKKADHKLEESMEYIKKDEMPLPGYVLLHAEARLSMEQKELLVAHFGRVRSGLELPKED
jgi:hypothetical protein